MKKFLFSMICTLFPIFASAQEPYAILIDNGTAIEFRYDDQKSAYRDAMDIGPFTEPIQRGWDSSAEGIYSVVFNESFAECSSITSTAYWFAGLNKLETFIGMEYLNTSNVTSMYMMFYHCTSLASLDLSNFNTQNVTDMTLMFASCNALTTITAGSDWTTVHVKDSGSMFESCFNLVGGNGTTFSQMNTDASYAHIDTEDNPGYLTGSSSGDEPYWQELNYMIEYGSEVLVQARESGKVDQWMLEELEMFLERGHEMYKEHTASAEEVRAMTEDLEWRIREVEEAMKGGGEEEPYAVLSEDNTVLTFYYDDQKEARGGMDVGPFTDGYESGWYEQRENIERVVFDESFASCTTIESTAYWFDECKNLTTIIDLSNLNTENVTDMEYMFYDCSGLTSLDVSGFNTENVTDMGNMFRGCSGLTSLDVSGFNTTNVTNMRMMFSGCSGLTSLDVSGFNTTNVTNMGGMFSDCSGLTSLDVSGFNTGNVTEMWEMFENCSGLASLDVSGFNTTNVTDMSYIFQDCPGLTSLDLSGFNTENVTYISGMFRGCSSLTSLDVSGFNTDNVTSMRSMFLGCSALTTIYVGSGWTTDNVLASSSSGENMFGECLALVGGAGTKYDADHTDYTYAHIDGGESNPGYLTGINGRNEAYYQNFTAYVYGDATLDDAFAEVGREAAVQTIAAIVWESNNELTSDQLQGITNPNLLVYVNEASKAPAGVQNVIIDGVAEEIILTDATGNNNFYCPQSFTAKSISYSRDFSQTTEIEVSRGWETIALPFDVQSITHESHGTLVPFGGEDSGYHFWLRQLFGSGLAGATQIKANKPYLISMPNNTIYPSVYNQNGTVTFSSTDVTVPETSAQSDGYENVTLHAAFQQVEQSSSIYALNVGEARGEYPEGSVFEHNYRDIRPFQAYTTHSAGTRFIPLGSLGGNDDATGIQELKVENSEFRDAEGAWYSLDGRRLYTKPTRKGVYVKDGRKIVIK